MLAPAILITVDDFDADYKVRGVRLIQCLITKVQSSQLITSGLGKVFLEVRAFVDSDGKIKFS